MKALPGKKTKAVAENIRKHREQLNYSQDYLARKLEVSQNAYSKIELGISNITVDRLFAIADVLDVDLADLLNIK